MVVIGLLALGGLGSATVAQDDDQTATSASAGVGAWLVTLVEGPYTLPRQMNLLADGTVLQWDGAALWTGSWEATGPSTGDITIVRYELDDAGYVVHDTVREAFEVAADGQSLTASYTLKSSGSDGTTTGEMGPATATATRIAIEPTGSPVAPLFPSTE